MPYPVLTIITINLSIAFIAPFLGAEL